MRNLDKIFFVSVDHDYWSTQVYEIRLLNCAILNNKNICDSVITRLAIEIPHAHKFQSFSQRKSLVPQ